jgi:hypothetical protein
VEHIAVALGAEFKIYLPQLMPQILRVLMHDTSKDRAVTIKVSTFFYAEEMDLTPQIYAVWTVFICQLICSLISKSGTYMLF